MTDPSIYDFISARARKVERDSASETESERERGGGGGRRGRSLYSNYYTSVLHDVPTVNLRYTSIIWIRIAASGITCSTKFFY